jgi:hypothetical protein
MTVHPDNIRKATNANCWECGYAPARVIVRQRRLCGVCWNKVMWLRWARRVLEEEG